MMKIVAGLGSVDEYVRFCEAGADEFFCGYVPYEWSKKYGTTAPLNRREVLCCNVQIGAWEEMKILASMVQIYKKPVHLTFNSLSYLPEQYPEIAQIISRCREIGFSSFIIADPALIWYLWKQNIKCEIHLSGELGEMNHSVVECFQQMNVKRVIFHRKNSPDDMEAVIRKSHINKMEYEAFALNELCQFSGSFCNSLHCDELGHLCRVPYWIGEIKKKTDERDRNAGLTDRDEEIADSEEPEGYQCGKTGCGLCSLYDLRKAGITHVKLVGRGNYVDWMEQDIRNLNQALRILDRSASEDEYRKNMKRELFPDGCSHNCYYL